MTDLSQLVVSLPSSEAAEVIANYLAEQVGGGIEQRDGETLLSASAEGRTELLSCMPTTEIGRHVKAVEALLSGLQAAGIETEGWAWRSEEIDPTEWVEAYRRFFKVLHIGARSVIRPSWEEYVPSGGEIVAVIDPGQAFGTGLHASTQLVVSSMERAAWVGASPNKIIDVGCGTGVLAILAAQLWPKAQIRAIDHDEKAVAIAKENVAQNGLSGRISVEHLDLREAKGRYGLALANLTYEALTELHPEISQRVEPRGRLIASGVLVERAYDLCRAYTRDLGFESEYSEGLEDWRALTLLRQD